LTSGLVYKRRCWQANGWGGSQTSCFCWRTSGWDNKLWAKANGGIITRWRGAKADWGYSALPFRFSFNIHIDKLYLQQPQPVTANNVPPSPCFGLKRGRHFDW